MSHTKFTKNPQLASLRESPGDEPRVDLRITSRRSGPTEIPCHSIAHQTSPDLLIMPVGQRAQDSSSEVQWVISTESKPRTLSCHRIKFYDCICQPSRRAHDGHGSIAHAVHLIQP